MFPLEILSAYKYIYKNNIKMHMIKIAIHAVK